MFGMSEKFDFHQTVIIGNRRTSMNHFYQCSVGNRCFCSVIWVTLMARVASRTLFGTAFPEVAEIGRSFEIFLGYFW